jgi:hypothetical protein
MPDRWILYSTKSETMGDLILDLKPNLGLTPEVIGYLASIKEHEYFYIDYNLRHPGGIFNIAFGDIINDFLDILVELEEYQSKYSEYNDNREINLGRKLRTLLIDLIRFRDSLYEVLQACCKHHTPPRKKDFIRTWLNMNKYSSGEELSDIIKSDLDYFNRINNKLKHTSSTVENIYFHDKKSSIFGFYVTGVNETGSIGPDEAIHPKFEGVYTANSYNFILRQLYYVIYRISYSFKDIILKHFRETYFIDLKFNSDYNSEDKRERELFYRMHNLPDIYFPNEVGKITYEFKLENDQLDLMEKRAESIDLHGYRIICRFAPDGFARTFTLPYKK